MWREKPWNSIYSGPNLLFLSVCIGHKCRIHLAMNLDYIKVNDGFWEHDIIPGTPLTRDDFRMFFSCLYCSIHVTLNTLIFCFRSSLLKQEDFPIWKTKQKKQKPQTNPKANWHLLFRIYRQCLKINWGQHAYLPEESSSLITVWRALYNLHKVDHRPRLGVFCGC